MNDFYGFSFCGHHSKDLHIVRTSDGSRYSENLSPNFQDVTAQVPGRDGTLYWDSFFTNKPFSIKFAFDSLSETDLHTLKTVFNPRAEGWLIFDEVPFKRYWSKVQGPAQISYVCFDENSARVYKGEGTITLICYEGIAHARAHFLADFRSDPLTVDNIDEWKDGTRMKNTTEREGAAVNYDQPISPTVENHNRTIIFNCGDVEADWVGVVNVIGDYNLPVWIRLSNNHGTYLQTLKLQDNYTLEEGDNYLIFDSRSGLIQGASDIHYHQSSEKKPCINYCTYDLTGTLYNKYIERGDFFKIPVSVLESGASPYSADYAIYFNDVDGDPTHTDIYWDPLYY